MGAKRTGWIAEVPETSAAYVLYMGEEAVYVGSSIRLRNRIHFHPHKGKFDSIRYFCCHPGALESLERSLVRDLAPRLNRNAVRRGDSWGKDSGGVCRNIHDKDRPYTRPEKTTGFIEITK